MKEQAASCKLRDEPTRTASAKLEGRSSRLEAGFTLVEMIVAVGLFAVVMLVSTGALLALVGANRKAQALQSVMGNLNIALDGMVRSIRMGNTYRCGSSNPTDPTCPSGGAVFYFKPYCSTDAGQTCPPQDWIYSFHHGRIWKSENGIISGERPITAPEVTIDSMTFYVVGAKRGDFIQPKVVITVKGTAGAFNIRTRTTFNIQATAVQRVLDL